MKREHIEVIRRAMSCACGDDLERANMAFSGMSEARLDQQWGQSGKTCREVWQEYKDHRRKWEEANQALESLIANRHEAA